jgi:aminoacyl tRNA synthase complex-interacting multifunctional protein 1
MAALDSAIDKLDGLILDMEKDATSGGASLPEIRFDPDDAWAQERAAPPPYVVKTRCPTTGYLMTRPFEAQCPMPEAFVKDNSYLRGMIKPVVKSKSAAAPSTSQSKPKAKEGGGKTVGGGEVDDFVKVLFKVAKVKSVEKHPDSDKLYVCKLDIGNGEERQVVAGLQKFIPIPELENILVVIVANLKKAKLAGTPSEAMILAAEFADTSKGPDGISVKTLVPPPGAQPGDIVFLEGMQPQEKYKTKLSSTVWAAVGACLSVQKGGHACFKDQSLCVSSGKITSPAPDGTTIR